MPELSNTERSPGLRSCLGDDVVLDLVNGRLQSERLQAVHAHLDRCPDCRRLVGEAVRESGEGSSGVHGSVALTTFRPGDLVGNRFRVERFIARGGMGEVYEAFDCDLQERVALKTVIPTTSDVARAVRRFKAEVQLAHRVSHPNVCRIYDLGSHRLDGEARVIHFLTMEFVEGERLSQRISRTGLTLCESTDIARQLLLGLRAAHAAGILHRDLKTDNVMLRTDAEGGVRPVILDFGLARTLDVVEHERLSSGMNGFMGTPCYMAPEQLQNGELSAATDLYAFGVIWFEMLTGRLPFSARAPFERLTKCPSKPSTVRTEVPPSTDKMVLRCLARSVDERYANADEVLRALEEPASEPVAAEVVPPARHPQKWRVVGPALFACIVLALFAFNHAKAPSSPVSREPEGTPRLNAAPLDRKTNDVEAPMIAPASADPREDQRGVAIAPDVATTATAQPRSPVFARRRSSPAASAPSAVGSATSAPAPSTVPNPAPSSTPASDGAGTPVKAVPPPSAFGFADPFHKR
jgi:serine/threonine protein kinase